MKSPFLIFTLLNRKVFVKILCAGLGDLICIHVKCKVEAESVRYIEFFFPFFHCVGVLRHLVIFHLPIIITTCEMMQPALYSCWEKPKLTRRSR